MGSYEVIGTPRVVSPEELLERESRRQAHEARRLANLPAECREALKTMLANLLENIGFDLNGQLPPVGTVVELKVTIPDDSDWGHVRFEFSPGKEAWEYLNDPKPSE